MTARIRSIIHPVKDLAKAKALYGELLGVEPIMDEPYYVGYKVGGLDIGLDPQGHSKGLAGSVAYWDVDDIRKTMQGLVDAGAEILQEPTDVGGGLLIALVKDTDGNVIGLSQPA
ncbi:VOC family protein [Kitasatospora sp. MAP5-34]|uniref:VOC family protein n=1 Tax=Kitasatospora sp. MAP5-34 TaxID=3035102 RepID=UPI0024757E68|nr:VOC family protein [Kitasatospora sp. MAP5-34]MDH6577805.1 putative enzyme related to lactoylglutathione lyase [Kitasatospora sp. MAP5-34]